MIKISSKNGYTLLFAVILSAVVLSIAAFIVGTSRKQFILSSMARDSTVAIYAADSGIQCAVQAYQFGDGTNLATTSDARIDCGSGAAITRSWSSPNTTDIAGMGFYTGDLAYYQVRWTSPPLEFALPNNTCVKITVVDGYYDKNGIKGHKTLIESRGYNMGVAGNCPKVNPRSIERAIRLQYMD